MTESRVGHWAYSIDGGERFGDTFTTRDEAIAAVLAEMEADLPCSVLIAQVAMEVSVRNALACAIDMERMIEEADDALYGDFGVDEPLVSNHLTGEQAADLERRLRGAINDWADAHGGMDHGVWYQVKDAEKVWLEVEG